MGFEYYAARSLPPAAPVLTDAQRGEIAAAAGGQRRLWLVSDEARPAEAAGTLLASLGSRVASASDFRDLRVSLAVPRAGGG